MNTSKAIRALLAFAVAAAMLLSACSAPVAAPTAAPSDTPAATQTPEPTASPEPTATPEPTPTATPEPTASPTPEPTATPAPTPTVDPDAPPVVRLYLRSTRKLSTGYDGKLIKGERNAEFFALPTDADSVERSAPKTLVEKYWSKYREEDYKIGYVVDITLKSGEVIHLNIRRPKDAPPIQHQPMYFSKFVEIYMYDSAKKDPDGGYGNYHLQEKYIKKGEKVLITNIKFHAGSKYADVSSIDVTAYVYKGEDEFDSNGEYTGSLSYHIQISK